MPSTYSSSLRLELMAQGENANSWGNKTNTNLDKIEQGITGYLTKDISLGGTQTLSVVDTSATADSPGRNAFIKFTGALAAHTTVVVPDISKSWWVRNSATGASVTFRTSSGTGFLLPANQWVLAIANGATAVDATQLPTLVSAGTYGSSISIPVITLDAYGRITSVVPTSIATYATATEASAGIIAIATSASANAGVSDSKAITPYKLATISPASVTWSSSDKLLILDSSDGDKLKKTTITTGKVLQVVNTQTGAVATTANAFTYGDSIPQSSGGAQLMSLEVTPTSDTSKLRIDVVVNGASSLGNITVALFKDSDTDALAGIARGAANAADVPLPTTFTHYMTAGTTSKITFKVRGGAGQGTFTFNGSGGSRLLGGVMSSSITITEIAA